MAEKTRAKVPIEPRKTYLCDDRSHLVISLLKPQVTAADLYIATLVVITTLFWLVLFRLALIARSPNILEFMPE